MTDCILFHLGAQGPGRAMRHYQQRALKPEPPQAIWSRDGRLDAGFGKQQTGVLLFGAAYHRFVVSGVGCKDILFRVFPQTAGMRRGA
jgi:hypothetical protein